MKQLIRLTESDLHRIVENSIKQTIMENSEDENFFNQLGRGFKSFMGRDTNGNSQKFGGDTSATYNPGARLKAGIRGYKSQGNIDSNNNAIQTLTSVAQRFNKPNMTLNQAILMLKRSNGGLNAGINHSVRNIYNS